MKNIILVGIMGCGKTTISKLLSEKLKMPVIDMDKYIEKKYLLPFKVCIAEITGICLPSLRNILGTEKVKHV